MDNLDSDKYKNYLYDLGILINELSLEAKKSAHEKKSDFSIGYLAGFHRVVSIMQQQALAFDIPLEQIALSNIDADIDLV